MISKNLTPQLHSTNSSIKQTQALIYFQHRKTMGEVEQLVMTKLRLTEEVKTLTESVATLESEKQSNKETIRMLEKTVIYRVSLTDQRKRSVAKEGKKRSCMMSFAADD